MVQFLHFVYHFFIIFVSWCHFDLYFSIFAFHQLLLLCFHHHYRTRLSSFVSIWAAAFSDFEKVGFPIIHHWMNGLGYQAVLDNCLKPLYFYCFETTNLVFVHDNAVIHNSKSTKMWLTHEYSCIKETSDLAQHKEFTIMDANVRSLKS